MQYFKGQCNDYNLPLRVQLITYTTRAYLVPPDCALYTSFDQRKAALSTPILNDTHSRSRARRAKPLLPPQYRSISSTPESALKDFVSRSERRATVGQIHRRFIERIQAEVDKIPRQIEHAHLFQSAPNPMFQRSHPNLIRNHSIFRRITIIITMPLSILLRLEQELQCHLPQGLQDPFR